jgi:hypothetical protein
MSSTLIDRHRPAMRRFLQLRNQRRHRCWCCAGGSPGALLQWVATRSASIA